MDENKPTKICGVEMAPEERTPVVEQLLRLVEQQRQEIQRLRDELARLKELPARPVIRPIR